jgi:demethylmenaquinone methyltransferase/2-methoxy-6-polyprenyl-1,4-benzoquinol methylase
MALSKRALVDLYRKRAKRYDWTARLYWLIGFAYDRYRQLAVDALDLDPGDTVVDVGCGTGLNFYSIEERIGPTGRLIGVDLTDAMLERARERVETEGWTNVDLVHSDAAEFTFPENVDGVLSTAAITLVLEYDAVIQRAAEALAPGGRISIFDFNEPEDAPEWFVRFMVAITRPFGVSRDLAIRHPWESVACYLPEHAMVNLYSGFAYVMVGRKPEAVPASDPPR